MDDKDRFVVPLPSKEFYQHICKDIGATLLNSCIRM